MADKPHWMRQPQWQAAIIVFGLLAWCFYLAFSWISALPFLAQALLGAAVGLTSMASYSNTQTKRSQYRRRTGVDLARLSLADMLALQKLLPSHEKALSWLPDPSDGELVRWINVGLEKAWPFFKEASSGLMKVKLEAVYNKYKSGAIQEILIGKINLGKCCPYVQGIRAFTKNEDDHCCLEIQLDWRQNEDQEMLLHVLTTGPEYVVQVKNFVVYCVMRLAFTPLTQELPCFAAVVFSIIEPPLVDFQTKFISGDVKKMPGMVKAVDNILLSALMDVLVWPGRVVVPVLPGDYSDLEASCVGHLHVQLVEARDLANKDITGRSNPYVVLFVRRRKDLIKESLRMHDAADPVWNEQFLFSVEDLEVQKLTIKLMDLDEANLDVFVGIAELAIDQLEPNILEDLWIDMVGDPAKMRGKSAGRIHLLVEFKPTNQTGAQNDTGRGALGVSAPSAVSLIQPDGSLSSTKEGDQSGAINVSESCIIGEVNRDAGDDLRDTSDGNSTVSANIECRQVAPDDGVTTLTDFSSAGTQGSLTLITRTKIQPWKGKDENSAYPEEKAQMRCYVDYGISQSANENGVEVAEIQWLSESKSHLHLPHVAEVRGSDKGIGTESNETSRSVFPKETGNLNTEKNCEACIVESNMYSNVDTGNDTEKNQQNLLVAGDPAWGLNGLSLEHCNTSVIHDDMFSSEIFEVD